MLKKFSIKFFIILSFVLLMGFFAQPNLQAANTIDGYCYLDGETVHNGSKVLFSAESPSAVTDSTFTDSSGYFSLDLESGLYDVVYSHPDRATYTIQDTFLTTTASLPSVTLYLALNGTVSDTLYSSHTYQVTGDVLLDSGDTLFIQPGTNIKFSGYYCFDINGMLIANGTLTDSILFTSAQTNPAAGDWLGIEFGSESDENCLLSYTMIEYADTALIINMSSLTVNNNLIQHNNTGFATINSAFPNIYNNTICNNTDKGFVCHTNSNPNIKNNIFYGNGTAIDAQSLPDALEYNLFWSNVTNGSGSNLPSYFGEIITVNANGDSCDTYFNLFMNPLFVDTLNANFHLTSNSPAIDAGDPVFVRNPDSTVADMGAYFYYQSNIRGNITLNGGSGLLTDVEITADTLSVNPDPNGYYQLTIPPGSYEVTASLTNYADTTKNGVQVVQFQSTENVDFMIDPLPGSISGTVSLANRIGNITEVEVTAGGITVNPDSSGAYTISPLFPGNYVVTASLANYADSTISNVAVIENQNTPGIDFTLIALPGIIEGNVSLSGGFEDVTNIEVSAGGQTVFPDTTGNYQISLQPGTYDVLASHANYTDSTVNNVNVLENTVSDSVDFMLDPLLGSVSGTVSLSNRVGDITEVEVTMDTVTVNPDSSGYYSFPSLYPDYYDITASLTNYHDSTKIDVQVLENQNTTTDFTLIALPGTIQGTVAISDSATQLSEVEISAGDVTVNADSTGSYTLSVQPGVYDVTAALTDYADTTITDVEVIENADTTGINFTLFPLPGTITGTVSLENRVGNITEVEVTAGGVTVNPDSSGFYSITLEEGFYDVAASLTNYQDSLIVDVAVNKNQATSEVDFTLIPLPGSISGQVNLSDRMGEITEVEVTVDTIIVNPDSSGYYIFESIYPGNYDVTASLPNYIDSTVTNVEVLENQTTTDVSFTLIAMPGSISGNVTLADKNWTIPEVEITAGTQTVSPDSSGDYTIPIQPGTYDVTATLTNYVDSTITGVVVLENQNTANIDFVLQPGFGSIEGIVTLIGGGGVVTDVSVNISDASANPDSTGYYLINNIEPGVYDVSASLNGYPTLTLNNIEVEVLQITPNVDLILISSPPNVNFSVTPDSGCIPLEVQFTDLSTKQPDSWFWEFGDGETSTEQNPSHIYFESGKFTVSLTASNYAGSNTLNKDELIKVGEPPDADFTGNPTSGTAPLGVSFLNQTTQISGFPTSWAWNFGDGNTSNSQSPGHVYENGGIYSVTLIASNACGPDTTIRTDYITVYEEPVAEFSAVPDSGCQPLTVSFTDQSSNNPSSWEWNFGDGTTTFAPNPNHEYDDWGSFTVSLTVTNPAGSDTETKTNFITVNGVPIADAGRDKSVIEQLEVSLDGSDSYDPEGDSLSYHWQAPDSIQISDSTIAQPTFIAPNVDDSTEFNFVLTVNDGCCFSEPDTVVITVKDNPIGVDELIPHRFVLVGIYPNPINHLAKISFGLPQASKINIELYDIKGRFLKILAEENMNSGYHTIEFNMSRLKSGVYFYKLNVNGVNKAVDKFILLR